jgi:hypothetical protein
MVRRLIVRSIRNPAATLELEIAQEKAAALGRLGRGLEAALAALRSFDAVLGPAASREDRRCRDDLVAQAGQALWYLMVQRDACGLYNNEALISDYRVPREVVNRAGPAPVVRAPAREPVEWTL